MFPFHPVPVHPVPVMDTIYEDEEEKEEEHEPETTSVLSCGERSRVRRQGPPRPPTHTVALGAHALSCHYQGQSNVAVGVNALAYGDGDYNVAVGTSALLYETQPHLNTVMGSNAMQGHGGGVSISAKNVAIGAQALYDYRHAERNTAVGTYSMLKLEEGDDNTCLGFHVGSHLVHKSHGNTLVGSGANVAQDGITDSTALGKGAIATESHQVVLGTDQETVVVPGSLVVEGYYTPYTRAQSLSWDATWRITLDVHALYTINHVPAPLPSTSTSTFTSELILPSTTYVRSGDWLVLYVVPPRTGEAGGAVRVVDSYGTDIVEVPAWSADRGPRQTLPVSHSCRFVYLPGVQPSTPWVVL